MAKVTLNHAFESMSGKLCRKGSTYVALNKQTGKMYTAEYHAREVTNSEALQQVKATFTKRAKFASLWWNANKPSTTNAAGTANYQLVMKAYKGQRKVGNPYSYLRSLVSPELKVMLGDLDITGNITSGGGSTDSNPSVKPGGSEAGGGGNIDA